MTLSNEQVIGNFGKGATKGHAAHIFIEGNVCYDFGYHFPLLVRFGWGILMNADKYSMTTTCHQNIASRIANVLIPFSVLSSSGACLMFYPRELDISIIDKSSERWDVTGYRKLVGDSYQYLTLAQYEKFPKREWPSWEEITERRPSAVVFKDNKTGDYYLSSMDGNNYFLSKLSHPVNTVDRAFDSLMPRNAGKDYLRQGEWFFIPQISNFNKTEWLCLKYSKKEQKHFELLPRNGGTGHHIATRARVVLGVPFVKGTVRHTNRDHRMLKLGDGKTWYMALESNHVQSWGANGRVD